MAIALLLLGVASGGVTAAPPEALAIALNHCRILPPETAKRTRFLDLTHLRAEERLEVARVLSFWLNSVSRSPDIVIPLSLGDNRVLAFDLRDYELNSVTYGGLGHSSGEPFYHVILELQDQYGKKIRQSAAAPWLNTQQITELMALTVSQVPIVRGDWFFAQTAIQADRAVGYYDMLGLGKKEADFYKLGGVNVQEAKRLRLEMAASVVNSTVALHNRSITRIQALTGGLWQTADFKSSSDKQNTARILKDDTDPNNGDFGEFYLPLPNGLFAYWLQDDKGNRADSAPDFIASDNKSTSPDHRVHAALSCIRCHTEGLRPIDDYARKLFTNPVQLRSYDFEKLKRLRQLYLSDLPSHLSADNLRYAVAVKACNGFTPATNAKAVATAWEVYQDTPVSCEQAARELGIDERRLVMAIRNYAVSGVVVDPVVASFAQTPPIAMSRDHFNEVYSVLQKIIGAIP